MKKIKLSGIPIESISPTQYAYKAVDNEASADYTGRNGGNVSEERKYNRGVQCPVRRR